ncbi:hypothetical protein DTO027B5_9056 [Paecilomyces variotii]|nr:hypothetical protein DTO021C3_8812 [Paecilomyces variotii]KAJ9320923.1 hypothetical protein DTO027B3_8085 [Paecilomyces variotii]KAJ9327098.1 hypothetical protein DTO027B5_9056 [Paecilomyces variotii]KAJ9394554.1 hypothetical protein DTO282F9_8543 [Paecilomyces variotii]
MTLKTYDLSVPLARNPVIVVTVFGVVATLTTVSRFLALQMRNVKPGAPEYLIIGALVSSDELYKGSVAKFAAQVIVYIFIAIQYILSILGGCGRRINEVDPASVVVTLKTILPLEALYGIAMSLVKTSIMLFFFRIFGTKRSFRISVAVVMVIVWMWAVSVILETLLLCRPLAYNWDATIDGVCGERNATYVVAGTLNLVTDLMVMALPIPHIWKLKLSVPKKLALCLVFCMGLLVSVISIVRLASLMAIDFTDITYSVQMGVMWTVLEPELAIICANMPVMKPILSRVFPNLFPSSNRRTYGVPGPQAFERLDEHSVYPLSRVGHGHLRADISAGCSHPNNEYMITTMESMDEMPRDSDQQGLRENAQSPDGINVTKHFDIKYHK